MGRNRFFMDSMCSCVNNDELVFIVSVCLGALVVSKEIIQSLEDKKVQPQQDKSLNVWPYHRKKTYYRLGTKRKVNKINYLSVDEWFT